ncbi:MAG: hypothetical protein C0501_16365 [Isosphaera sp.]|nr:hypothetical protein [Isosphaera sp.]
MTAVRPIAVLVLAAALAGCGKKSAPMPDSTPGPDPAAGDRTPAGGDPKAMLEEFLKPGADHAALTKKLRPTKADYEAVFEPEFAAKFEAFRAKDWDSGLAGVAPKRGQAAVLVTSATTEELRAGAANFPGGYKQVADKFKPGLTVYVFEFVEPGKNSGLRFDGLVKVNGNWRLFPKPWQAK